MNIHINRLTRFQSWEGKTIFNEYPLHIRPGNFTVTLLFHDTECIDKLRQILDDTVAEIESGRFSEKELLVPLTSVKKKKRL